MYYNQCTDFTYNDIGLVEDNLTIATTVVVSILMGLCGAVSCVGCTLMGDIMESTGIDLSLDDGKDSVDETEQERLDSEIDAVFSNLPVDGSFIDEYPFEYVLEDETVFGRIVMLLNVYNDDYETNPDSVDYTYYTDSSKLIFNDLERVAKKIAIELGSKRFYFKDKVVDNHIVVEDSETSLQLDSVDGDGVFAKLKPYNKSRGSSAQNKTSDKAIISELVRFRRIGKCYDYDTAIKLKGSPLSLKIATYKDYISNVFNVIK